MSSQPRTLSGTMLLIELVLVLSDYLNLTLIQASPICEAIGTISKAPSNA